MSGDFIGDLTDYSVSKIAIGALFGYAAGVTDCVHEKCGIAAVLLGYRLLHHYGLFEINFNRTSLATVNHSPSRRRHGNFLADFAKSNLLVLGGFATGYLASNIGGGGGGGSGGGKAGSSTTTPSSSSSSSSIGKAEVSPPSTGSPK